MNVRIPPMIAINLILVVIIVLIEIFIVISLTYAIVAPVG